MSDRNEEEPPSINLIANDYSPSRENAKPQDTSSAISRFFKQLFKTKTDSSLRETIEEYIEEKSEYEDANPSVSVHEKALISNVLELRDLCVTDVMVPRADIIAISDTTTPDELFKLLSEQQYSRFPVYNNTLDHVLGSIHIKDILATVSRGEDVVLTNMIREVPIVSPAMKVLDLLLQMQITRKHLVFVIDEYGGIDGLVTIGDIIEAIVGEIDDEHDNEEQPEIKEQTDGSYLADARYDLEEFEEKFGNVLSEEEREENDTLGGLVFSIAGRIPGRGEILTHDSGIIFEVIDADPRRINRLRIRNIPERIPVE